MVVPPVRYDFAGEDAHLVLKLDDASGQLGLEVGLALLFEINLLTNQEDKQAPAEGLLDGPRAGGHHFLESSHYEADGALGAGGPPAAKDAGGFIASFQVVGELLVKALLAQGRLETLPCGPGALQRGPCREHPRLRAWCGGP